MLKLRLLQLNQLIVCKLNFSTKGGMRVKELAACSLQVELPRLVNRSVLERWCASVIGIRIGVTTRLGSVTSFVPSMIESKPS